MSRAILLCTISDIGFLPNSNHWGFYEATVYLIKVNGFLMHRRFSLKAPVLKNNTVAEARTAARHYFDNSVSF